MLDCEHLLVSIAAVSLTLSSGFLELVIKAGCPHVLFCSSISKANSVGVSGGIYFKL